MRGPLRPSRRQGQARDRIRSRLILESCGRHPERGLRYRFTLTSYQSLCEVEPLFQLGNARLERLNVGPLVLDLLPPAEVAIAPISLAATAPAPEHFEGEPEHCEPEQHSEESHCYSLLSSSLLPASRPS